MRKKRISYKRNIKINIFTKDSQFLSPNKVEFKRFDLNIIEANKYLHYNPDFKVCTFSPNSGLNIGKVCCQFPVIKGKSSSTWRCKECISLENNYEWISLPISPLVVEKYINYLNNTPKISPKTESNFKIEFNSN